MDSASRPCRSANATAVSSTRPWLRRARESVAGSALAMTWFGLPPCGFLQCTNSLFLQRKNPVGEEPRMQSSNLAARAGRWSAQHRKTAILGWLVFVVLAVVVGGRIGLNALDESASGSGESKRGDMIVEAAGFPQRAGEQVLVQGSSAGDPAVTATVRDVGMRLKRIEGVSEVQRPVASKDGRSVLVSFKLRGTDEQVAKLVEQPVAAVAAVQRAHRSVRVEQFGEASATKAIAAQDAKDGKRAHLISYAVLLIILLGAFGAVAAAGLPLVLGATAVAGTVGLLGPVSQLYALPADVAELVAIIGLAVGVDYAMFYSRRVMEERDRGHSIDAAAKADP